MLEAVLWLDAVAAADVANGDVVAVVGSDVGAVVVAAGMLGTTLNVWRIVEMMNEKM